MLDIFKEILGAIRCRLGYHDNEIIGLYRGIASETKCLRCDHHVPGVVWPRPPADWGLPDQRSVPPMPEVKPPMMINAFKIATKIIEDITDPKSLPQLAAGIEAIGLRYRGKPKTSSVSMEIAAECDRLLLAAYCNGVFSKKYTSTVGFEHRSVMVHLVDPDTDDIIESLPDSDG